MVSAGSELMGERRRQLNLSGLYCTWWDKGAVGLRQMPKMKLQTFGLPILILIQVSPWSQEETEKADRTETYRTKDIIIQNVVVCLLRSRLGAVDRGMNKTCLLPWSCSYTVRER